MYLLRIPIQEVCGFEDEVGGRGVKSVIFQHKQVQNDVLGVGISNL